MSNQTMVYDTDNGGWQDRHPRFQVDTNAPMLIRAAGLTEEIAIYQMVGECEDCSPEDILWSPVYLCGQQLTLSETNTQLWVTTPGIYSVGDPVNPVTLAGDVNITRQAYRGIDMAYVNNTCCGSSAGGETGDVTVEVNIPECPATGSLGVITDLSVLVSSGTENLVEREQTATEQKEQVAVNQTATEQKEQVAVKQTLTKQ